MANSKSNIYPIALQNAELNLNKYDAEIKQYSGFNKNNAPFVGGCLSNIFTKDEVIEGGNSDNVYIDDNGDVYRTEVNTETNTGYLYKNDQVIRTIEDFNNWAVERKEISFEEDIVNIFDEKLYVYRVMNYSHSNYYYYKYYVKFYNRFTETWEDVYLRRGYNYQDFNIKDITDDNSFDSKRISTETSDFIVIGFRGYDFDLGTNVINAGVKVFYRSETDNYEADKKTNSYNSEWPVIVHVARNVNGSNTYSCYLFRNGGGTVLCLRSDFSLSAGTLSEFSVEDENFNTNYLHKTGSDVDGLLYRVTQTEIYFVGTVDLSSQVYNMRNNEFTVYANYYLNSSNNKISFEDKTSSNVFSHGDTTYAIVGSMNNSNSVSRNYLNFFSAYGIVYCLLFKHHTSDSEVWRQVSCCGDYLNPGVSFDDKDIPHFPFGVMLGNHVLINNEVITGLYHRNCLLTEWNSVDKVYFTDCWNDYGANKLNLFKYVTHDNLYVIYTTQDGTFYKITKSNKLVIKKILNLLVMNVCTEKNSFNLKTGKFLNYAPCYNNYITPLINSFIRGSNTFTCNFSDDNTNKSYMASAVNEYNQKYNSSILLNPQPISITITGSNNFIKKVEKLPISEIFLNFYYGENSSIDYFVSSILKRFYYNHSDFEYLNLKSFEPLVGLPFPIDSNGNVEYSPNLFSEIKSIYGNQSFIKDNNAFYPLAIGNDNEPIMSYFMASGIEGLEDGFIIQGQFYGILNKGIYNVSFYNGVLANVQFIVSVDNLQFCGNTPYEALFFSKTNRCLYSFTGANILQQKQLVDKIKVVKSYKYNPATQSIFLLTDIGVLVSSLFGIYMIDMPEAENVFLLDNGIVLTDNVGNYRYIRYYKDNSDDDYLKENILLETCFYGMNNQTITINDCLYLRLFSEEHEEGEIKISATTISLKGRKTETTTFKIKARDWDKETHTIYMRYQPKEQRGLGISFAIESPFKIASMSVGSQADAILVDKVSKGAINAPFNNTSSTIEW